MCLTSDASRVSMLASDALKFWKELFDEKSKSEATDRNLSEFKLSVLRWEQHQKKKVELKKLF